MYIETTQQNYQTLKQYLIEQGIYFEASDCTLPGDTKKMVHIELANGIQLTNVQKDTINNIIDQAINKVISQADRAKLLSVDEDPLRDTDGNGLSDNLEQILESEQVESPRRHRPWDQKMHTPTEAAVGWFTGEADKEERD